YLNLAAAQDHDVGRFDVSVNDPALMGKPKSAEHLRNNCHAAAGVEWTGCLEKGIETASLDIFHGKERHPMILAKVEDGNDIGMKTPPRRSRLTAEALQPLIGAATRRQIGSHDFYCHHPVDDGIVSAINFAHCAGAEQSLDAVTADAVDRLHGPSLAASSIGRYAI